MFYGQRTRLDTLEFKSVKMEKSNREASISISSDVW